MNWIRLSINQPVLIIMIECFLVTLGLLGLGKLGVDLYPEVDPPVITITTEYPGAGPEEIETLISKPIEEQVNQLGGIEKIQSTSREGLSQVVIEFQLKIDAQQAKIDVTDKLSQVRPDLPEGIEEPLVERLDFSDKPIYRLALFRADDAPGESELIRMRQVAEDRLKPLLQQVDGVGQVNLFGGLVREIQVRLDFTRMQLWKMTPEEVAGALARANRNVPSGDIREAPVSRSIRLVGEYQDVAEVESTLIRTLPGGKAVTVRDVATVADHFEEPDSLARYQGRPAVVMEIKRQSGRNTVAVADGIASRIPALQAQLPSGLRLEAVYDGSEKIRMSVNDVMETLVIAGILTVVVVYFFLGSWESTFITGFALPTTILSTFFFLYLLGYTLNIMTLLGITLAVGLLLDDAIVVRENIWHKITEGMAPVKAAEIGTREVVIAVLATSATVLAVFFPVTLIPGVVGRFFTAFAITVCVAVILSTFDALTVAPMLSAYFVRGGKRKQEPHRWVRAVQSVGTPFCRTYEWLLDRCLARPRRTLLAGAAIFVSSLFLVPLIGFTFLPSDESGEMEIAFEAPVGSTVDTSGRIAGEIETELNRIPEVAFHSTRVGNEFGEENTAVIYVRLVEASDRSLGTSGVKEKVRQALESLAARESLDLYIRNVGSGGQGKPIQVAIEGPDTNRLMAISEQAIASLRREVPGAINLESSLEPGRGEIQLHVDRTRAALFGLSPAAIGNVLRGWFEGLVPSKFRDAGEEYDIRVRLDEAYRLTSLVLDRAEIYGPASEPIPLKAVVRPVEATAPGRIIRLNQQRAALIEGELADGAALGEVLGEVKTVVEGLLPPGYRLKFEGQAKSLSDLRTGALVALGLGALFIYMIMASLYGSYVLPFCILLTLPLAVSGALVGLLLTGRFMDVYAVIGMILLMGIVTKNAILLLDYLEQLRAQGVERFEAIRQAGLRRFRPIMMTTIAMVAGMMPVAAGVGELNQVRAGMGIASIAGLISSTVLSLVVVPCAYIYLDDFRQWSRSKVQALGYTLRERGKVHV